MPLIYDMDNLNLAAYKAIKGRRQKRDVVCFMNDFQRRIIKMREELMDGSIEIGNYHYFTIYDPKERIICAASLKERVLHHAIMNVCHPYFERRLIYDTYATRIGKGTYKALKRASNYMRGYHYYAKLDFRKYYDSINHSILKDILATMFKDEDLLALFGRIIDSYHTTEDCGLPIGNLTSQYFANIYLSSTDHYMKEVLRAPVYIRYMDDILMMHNSRSELKRLVNALQDYASDKRHLTLKPVQIGQTTNGAVFLGYRVFPGMMTLSGRSKRRFRHKILKYNKEFVNEQMSIEDYNARINALYAFVLHAQAQKFYKGVMSIGLEPRQPWWQLEQQREEHSRLES